MVSEELSGIASFDRLEEQSKTAGVLIVQRFKTTLLSKSRDWRSLLCFKALLTWIRMITLCISPE